MNSILPSESAQLLSIQGLNISYQTMLSSHSSFRDRFVEILGGRKNNKRVLEVLENFHFVVHKGDRVGVLGVNGSGKTSLCRAIAGMYMPKIGSIQTFGEVRAIFDTGAAIIPELTGRENAYLLARMLYPRLRELGDLVNESLEFSELGDYLDMPFKNYSKGMQARLCLSLISARPCDLLILDEVFDGADQFFQTKISARVSKMIEASGAVIFVAHSPEQIRRTCNRAIVISERRLAYEGDIEGALDFYQSLGGGGGASCGATVVEGFLDSVGPGF